MAEVTTSQPPDNTGFVQEWMIRDVPRLIRQYSVSWTLVRWIGIGQNLGVACTEFLRSSLCAISVASKATPVSVPGHMKILAYIMTRIS
jgi:hypothetical protein